MLRHVWTGTTIGVDAILVEIEIHYAPGLPHIVIVGLPHGAAKESFDRVKAALRAADYPIPTGSITINLAPAGVRKDGALFDLPLALGMLSTVGACSSSAALGRTTVVGELSLSGRVRAARGVLPIVLAARKRGMKSVIVPAANAAEASIVEGLTVYAVAHLSEAIRAVEGHRAPYLRRTEPLGSIDLSSSEDFSDVVGQVEAIRALEIAASGGHNVLLVGPPGSGKTMLARRLPAIMPPLTQEEAVECAKIKSVVGGWNGRHGLDSRRPFRAPHHTISDAGLCGGGSYLRPGEITLAHNGVLFLDEFPEFKRRALESLRQPLESGSIVLSRASGTIEYPARFVLLASMNPCPCGYLTDNRNECGCSESMVRRYRARVSGPMLDRIDMHVEVARVAPEALISRRDQNAASSAIRARVLDAREIQLARFRNKTPSVTTNARMSPRATRRFCRLDRATGEFLSNAIDRLALSARAHDRILRIARSIADLGGRETIGRAEIAEAVQYRSLDRRL